MTMPTDAAPEVATLHLVRAQINVRELHRWMGEKRLQDQDHAMHCLLVECFGDLAPKPFRLITPRDLPSGVLYGYGTADADSLKEALGIFADPLQARIVPAEALEGKPMPSAWLAGQRLGFETRIRPIIRRSRNAKDRPGKECDAFLHEALQFPKDGMGRTREEVYNEWLAEQFRHRGGADLDVEHTRLVAFQRTRAVRKLHARHSEGPDALLRGILTVTEPAAFATLLAQGIGRHRAYGYGMLLLRPVRQ